MAVTAFENNIAALDFSFKKKKVEGGVILTANYNTRSDIVSPQELFALEIAKEKFAADAVYFRYFEDGRGAIPQIYLYDNTSEHLTEKDKKNIHIKVWSGCQVPMFIIIGKTEVKIFDAREKVEEDIENLAFETIKLTATAAKQFSAKSFDDGLFWEEKNNEKRFQFETSAYRDLIAGLKNVYIDFQKTSGLNSHVALKLLVQCLLIKYLEERDEQSENGYFAKTYFKRNFNSNNFCEVISSGQLLSLLDKLAADFNGKIFEWSKEDEKDERTAISQSKVQKLAEYLNGKIENNDQFVLWRLYSFSHLPVELISSVYEELLTDSKDIVYTPEMIVSTLVDECMPLKSPKQDFKLIDVSCGSGIFLVKAYKRIIQWWRYEKWLETGELIKPPLNILRQLLQESIHGRDIEGDAVRLSVFSLALALLDEVDLDPPTWQKLKFVDLSNNIIETDFFKYIASKPIADFDLIIGNPPFNLQTVNGKELDRKEHFEKIKDEYGYQSEVKIPDNNPALHFLVQSMKLLKPEALLCLIQPSGPLLYQKDREFKEALFSQHNLLQIIDFTKLADVLWGKRNIATAAIFLQKSAPDNENTMHVIANRTFSNLNRLFLELDHYDFHEINKDSILSNPNIWKSNLLGGARVVTLIERLSKLRILKKFIKEKTKEGWKKGEGFIIKGDKNLADYITEQNFLPTECFTENGINWDGVIKSDIIYFHRPRPKELYSPPHLLIRKILGKEKLITEYTENYLTFLSDIFAIHAPASDKEELQNLSNYIEANGKLLRFYILATSSRVKINKATSLYDEDILHLPYPEKLSDAKLSKAEELLVEDSLNYVFPSDAEKKLRASAEIINVKSFSKVYCKTLNSVYKSNNKTFQLYKILDAGNYYALHYEYTDKDYKVALEETADLEQYIKEIIPTEKTKGKSVHTQRIFKAYAKDTIILAKPKQLRYWLQSIALRDADETFADYIKARYR